MMYRRSDSLHIVGYSDSDYAGDDRKSTSGYVFTLAGGAIHGKVQSKPPPLRLATCCPTLLVTKVLFAMKHLH